MPRGTQSNVANTAVRWYFERIGLGYDAQRGHPPLTDAVWLRDVARGYFFNQCCYCDAPFSVLSKPVMEHLVPINQTAGGLHCWGNVVPACKPCNDLKNGRDWIDFIIEEGKPNLSARKKYIEGYVMHYGYNPVRDLPDLPGSAKELYDEAGQIVATLVGIKVQRRGY